MFLGTRRKADRQIGGALRMNKAWQAFGADWRQSRRIKIGAVVESVIRISGNAIATSKVSALSGVKAVAVLPLRRTANHVRSGIEPEQRKKPIQTG